MKKTLHLVQNTRLGVALLICTAGTRQRWALDWRWIGLDLGYDEFCWFWIGSRLQNASKI